MAGQDDIGRKIGQMCQITIDVVTNFDASRKNGFTLDKAKLDTVIGKYKVGSLLNVPLSVAQTKENGPNLSGRFRNSR